MIETKFVTEYQTTFRNYHNQYSSQFLKNISDKPFNPLINSGALLSSALLLQLVKPELDDLARKYEYVMEIFEVSVNILYVLPFSSIQIFSYRILFNKIIIFIDRKLQVGKPFSSTTPFILQKKALLIEISLWLTFWGKISAFLLVQISKERSNYIFKYVSVIDKCLITISM